MVINIIPLRLLWLVPKPTLIFSTHFSFNLRNEYYDNFLAGTGPFNTHLEINLLYSRDLLIPLCQDIIKLLPVELNKHQESNCKLKLKVKSSVKIFINVPEYRVPAKPHLHQPTSEILRGLITLRGFIGYLSDLSKFNYSEILTYLGLKHHQDNLTDLVLDLILSSLAFHIYPIWS